MQKDQQQSANKQNHQTGAGEEDLQAFSDQAGFKIDSLKTFLCCVYLSSAEQPCESRHAGELSKGVYASGEEAFSLLFTSTDNFCIFIVSR